MKEVGTIGAERKRSIQELSAAAEEGSTLVKTSSEGVELKEEDPMKRCQTGPYMRTSCFHHMRTQ